MAYGVGRAQQTLAVRYIGQVDIDAHAVVNHGAYLEEVELSRPVRAEVDGKLYLYRTAHLLSTHLEDLLYHLGQREHPIVEHSAEGDDLAVAALVIAVVYLLVLRQVGGAYVGQGAVLLRLPDRQPLEVESIVG